MTARRLPHLSSPLGLLCAFIVGLLVVVESLRIPALARLAPLPALRLLSSAGPLGELAPLSAAYVDSVLGIERPARPVGVDDSSQPAVVPAERRGAEGVGPDRGVTEAHGFDNDQITEARAIPRLPYAATADTSGATRDKGEPTSCSALGGTTWYRFTAAKSGPLFADTFGTAHATALGVFTGTSPSRLAPVGCGTSTGGGAQVGLLAEAGKSYWFQIAGTVGGGRTSFHLAAVGPTTGVASGIVDFRDWSITPDHQKIAFVGVVAAGCPADERAVGTCAALMLGDLRTSALRMILRTRPTTGQAANGESSTHIFYPSLSDDGRYLAFNTTDDAVVPGDTNGVDDVFVFDAVTGRTTRVSVTSDGRQAEWDPVSNGTLYTVGVGSGSARPSLSGDGRYVSFASDSNTLSEGDTLGAIDIFRHDRLTGETRLLSLAPDGKRFAANSFPGNQSGDARRVGFSVASTNTEELDSEPSALNYLWDSQVGTVQIHGHTDARRDMISRDGRTLAFLALSTAGPAGHLDAWLVDIADVRRPRARMVLADVQPPGGGNPTDGYANNTPLNSQPSTRVFLSDDGRYLLLNSAADRFVPGDTNGVADVFVLDSREGSIARISLDHTGSQFSTPSNGAAMSADGHSLAFYNDGSLYLHRSDVPGRP